MPDESPTLTVTPTLYFGYGSNIWFKQMNHRCPENKYIGTAVLHGWRWIINQRGYANIIPSRGDYVYGFIYELNAKDEASLDRYEGVPHIYQKEIHSVKLKASLDDGETDTKKTIDALVYIDNASTSPGEVKTEYIHRINMAMHDGIKNGIPQSYIDKYIRPFIPPPATVEI